MNRKEDKVVRSSGNKNKAGIVENNLDVLERKLQQAIVTRQGSLHYDELCKFGHAGFVYNKTKPVRNEDGQIDVFETFRKVRNEEMSAGFGGHYNLFPKE